MNGRSTHNFLGLEARGTCPEELLQGIFPNVTLDSDVKDAFSNLATDLIKGIVGSSSLLTAHRKSDKLSVEDVALFLKSYCKIDPSLISDEFYYVESSLPSENDKQAVALSTKRSNPRKFNTAAEKDSGTNSLDLEEDGFLSTLESDDFWSTSLSEEEDNIKKTVPRPKFKTSRGRGRGIPSKSCPRVSKTKTKSTNKKG